MHEENVVYSQLTEEYIDAAIRLMAEIFSKRELLVLHLGITEQEMIELLEPTFRSGRAKRSSIACFKGKVVGVILAESFNDPEIMLTQAQIVRFSPIFDLLKHMVDEFFQRHPIDSNLVHHQMMIAVDHNYKHLGVCEKLVAHNKQLAAEHGSTHALGEVSGPASHKFIDRGCGYQFDKKYYYKDLENGPAAQLRDIKTTEYCGLAWTKV